MNKFFKPDKPTATVDLAVLESRIANLEKQVDQASKLLTETKAELNVLKRANPCLTKTDKNKTVSIISNVLFYSCLVMLILGAFVFLNNTKTNSSILGFNLCNVKTDSMSPVYSPGSLLIIKSIEPSYIKVGDDITVSFIDRNGENQYLTHRVADIDKDTSGDLLFYTHAINPIVSDKIPFKQDALVGKVVLSIPFLGNFLGFIGDNKTIFILLLIVALALSFIMRIKPLIDIHSKSKSCSATKGS